MQCIATSASRLPGIMASIAVALCAWPAIGESNGEALTAGTESSVVLPQTGAQMKVFLPVNYRRDVMWPVIFFYPGQGGAPSTTFIRHYTSDRDFIVVGLPYVTPESDKPLPDFASREQQNLHAARQWLAAHTSMNEARVFLGGISKGGWTTSQLGEPELAHLAGLIILLAGRSYNCTVLPGGTAYRGKPIYIGDGETDNNMRAARQAAMFFQLQGAAVTFEEYLGLGHATPQEAPRLRTWLLVQNRYPARDAAALVELGPWFTNSVNAVRATNDVSEEFRLTLELVRDPRLWLCGPQAGTTAQGLLKEVTAHPPAREEWAAENTYWNLLWKVANLRLLDDLRATRDAFKQLSATYPDSRWGRLAIEDYRILANAYDRASSITNRPTMSGVNNRGIPVPVRIGNKIIFER